MAKLWISKKFFRVPVGILKSKIRFWSLPKLLLIITLLLFMHVITIIVQLMHSIICYTYNKVLLHRNAIRRKMWQ